MLSTSVKCLWNWSEICHLTSFEQTGPTEFSHDKDSGVKDKEITQKERDKDEDSMPKTRNEPKVYAQETVRLEICILTGFHLFVRQHTQDKEIGNKNLSIDQKQKTRTID